MALAPLARRLTASAVKRGAVGWDRLRPPAPGLVILAYHRVGRRTDSVVDLPTWLFAEQMARLAAAYRVVSMDEALAHLAAPGPTPTGQPTTPARAGPPAPPTTADRRPLLAVTFDDGTVDLVDEALPVLVEHRVPATVYVATAFVEEGRPFPGDGQPVSWAGLAEAASTGLVTVGSHTHHHALLDRVGATEVAKELDRSIGLIGERLGVAPRHFAYPKAVPGHAGAQAEVQARFASAALAGTRPNVPGRADPYRLARSPIQVDDGLRYFAAKAAGGMTLEDTLRRAANRLRYATVQA